MLDWITCIYKIVSTNGSVVTALLNGNPQRAPSWQIDQTHQRLNEYRLPERMGDHVYATRWYTYSGITLIE